MEPLIADANFLLRLLTRHPPAQFQAAIKLLETLEAEGQRVEVHPMHVAEAVFVLEGSVYQLPAKTVAQELEVLLSAGVFRLRDGGAILAALAAYPGSGLEFPDIFLRELARQEGRRVVTFDRRLARSSSALVPGAVKDEPH